MAAERYVIGIDCSTTATKAVVWDERGNSVAEGRAAFPLEAPRPGWYEQDAEEWWRSVKTALKEAAARVDTAADKNPQRTRDRLILKEITSDQMAPFRV